MCVLHQYFLYIVLLTELQAFLIRDSLDGAHYAQNFSTSRSFILFGEIDGHSALKLLCGV